MAGACQWTGAGVDISPAESSSVSGMSSCLDPLGAEEVPDHGEVCAGHHGLVQGDDEGHEGGDDKTGAGGDEVVPQSPPVTARQQKAPDWRAGQKTSLQVAHSSGLSWLSSLQLVNMGGEGAG